jgi:hypothetical protein
MVFFPFVLTGGIRAPIRLLTDAAPCPHHFRQRVVESEDMSTQVAFPISVVKSAPIYKRDVEK